MAGSKEQFAISVQSVIQSVDEVTERLKKTRQLCQEILAELQDESKLGSFSEFDFGKSELEKEGRKIHKEIHKKLESVEKQLRSLVQPMKEEQARTASKMTDRLESPESGK